MRATRSTSDRWRDDDRGTPSSSGSVKYHGRHPFDTHKRRRNTLLIGIVSFLACVALYFSRGSDRTSLRPRSSAHRIESEDTTPTIKADEEKAIDATQASRESTEATDRAAKAAADLVDTLDAARDAADELRRVAAAAAHKKRVADRAMAAAAAMQMKQSKGGNKGGETEIASMRERKVTLKDGTEASFSIFGRSENDVSVFVLPFNTKTKHFTLVEEFHPGPNQQMKGLIAGMFEPKHGGSAEKAAIWELSEEARLKLGEESKLISLAPDARGGFSQDKYSSAHFLPFLALDCVEDTRPRPRDREENIQVHHDISVDDLRKLVKEGKLNMASTSFAMMGIHYLEENGML